MKILTLAEAAERLGISHSTLRNQVRSGRLNATLIGKTWTVTEREVERYRAESLGRAGRPQVRCSACHRRPAKFSTGPTWLLCERCMAASDEYDRANGLEGRTRLPV